MLSLLVVVLGLARVPVIVLVSVIVHCSPFVVMVLVLVRWCCSWSLRMFLLCVIVIGLLFLFVVLTRDTGVVPCSSLLFLCLLLFLLL